MSDHRGTPAAGWFPDPSQAGMLRWWDGAQWTQHTHPMPAAQPAYGWVDPQRAVADEAKTAHWARNGIVVYGLLTLASIYLAIRLFDGFREQMQVMMANPEAVPSDPAAMFGAEGPFFALSQLFNGVQLGIFVLLLVWIYRAAVAAAALGIPARRSPGWAVGGWFIPVVNFWFPCQSLRDLLPPDHPTRTRILWLWIVAVVAQMLALFGVFFAFVTSSGPVFALVCGAVVAAALIAGRTVIDDVLACHQELAGRARTHG